MNLSKGIKYARELTKQSQKTLAARAKIAQPYLSAVESGRQSASHKVVEKIALACNVSPLVIYIASAEDHDLPADNPKSNKEIITEAINLFI